ncbi:Membrane protein-like protein [Elusimicrobium minutum Pei191]|uniref:Membrane protein-like protein n=1 Tax=Elusimicrobium minutum (strain Pei191) TaxID=445932 RepID=B2KEA2_ELUMP|nr:DUF2157 domain-containing protein [Elusimicrobium minutum]ACC98848.1 Membrane protein-like protein [Elusimicrobium minutum Pei191]
MKDIKEKLGALYDKSLISYKDYTALLEQACPTDWKTLLGRGLLFLSAVLFLAGVIFLFAYNWFAIPKFVKFGACALLILLSAAGVVIKGFNKASGQAFAFAVCFLIGAFCALFGQIYQTGADAWQLFATWAALIFPLALTANKTSIWLLFAVIINTTLFLFPFDMLRYAIFSYKSLVFAVFTVNFSFLALSEIPFKHFKQEAYFYYVVNTFLTGFLIFSCSFKPLTSYYSLILISWLTVNSLYHYFKRQDIYFIGISFLGAGFVIFINLQKYFLRDYYLAWAITGLLLSAGLGYALVYLTKHIKGKAVADDK